MVKNIFKKGLQALTLKQSNIFTAAFFIVATTIAGQILGLLKYRLLVAIFGASSDLGVFLAAFRVPDFLFQVFITGALSTSFIPIFSEFISQDRKEESNRFTSAILSYGVAAFLIISLFVIVFSHPLSHAVAPGFSARELTLMANLMIIIQFSEIFFVVGTVFSGVLQSYQHFLVPGIASALYNLGIIIGIVVLSGVLHLGIYGATIGVVIGAFFFFVTQLPLLKGTGFHFQLTFHRDEAVKKLIKLMGPRSLTLLIAQVAITANVFFASFTTARGLVILELAQTLMLAPVLLFGQSIAQASFPSLALKSRDPKEFVSIFVSSLNQIMYLTLPISALLVVLRIPVVRLFFGASRFDWDATVATGLTLALLGISIAAQSAIYLFSRAFFALKDTQTPFFITLFSVLVNIGLSYYFILVLKLPVYYLGVSFTVGNIISFILLMITLNAKITLPKLEIVITTIKILTATLVMGVALYIPIKLLDQLVFDTTRTVNLLILTGIASITGIIAYIFFTWLLDIKEALYVIAVVKQFKYHDRIIKQIGELLDGSKLNP
jgi:putative peptidoglycan lipid II flippase